MAWRNKSHNTDFVIYILWKRENYFTFGSLSSNIEGFFAIRGPRGTKFTITIRPSWDWMALLASNLALKHFNNGGVDSESGSHSPFLGLLHGQLWDLRQEGRPCVESVWDLLKLQLGGAKAHNFRLTLLRDQDFATASNGFFGWGAIARLPFSFNEKISNSVQKTEEEIHKV